ncbi:MAG: zinc-dependent alcohol dehydrogenase [Ferrimicrobium sp.]
MIPNTQTVLVAKQPGQLGLEIRSVPTPASNEILLKVAAVGLCGTDLEIVDGTIDPAYVRYPISIGHELSATTISDPSGTLPPGSPVVVEGIVPCWNCVRCRAGQTNLCETYAEIGFTRDGGAAEYVCVPLHQAHLLGPDVSLEAAALIEPGAVAYRGLTRTNPSPGWRCLVIGDGTIALLTAHLLQLWSPIEVTVLGKRSEQANLTLLAGATRFETDARTVGQGFDLVVEASGSVEGASSALGACRRGGNVLFLGLPAHGSMVPMALDDAVNNDLIMVASFGYTANAWSNVVKLFNSGSFQPDFLITHRFHLKNWERALETLRHAQGPRGKVLLVP